MSGPRDPTPYEADMYKSAIASKDGPRLQKLTGMYPNVLWGSVTRELSAGDQKWVMQNVEPEPQPADDDWSWG